MDGPSEGFRHSQGGGTRLGTDLGPAHGAVVVEENAGVFHGPDLVRRGAQARRAEVGGGAREIGPILEPHSGGTPLI